MTSSTLPPDQSCRIYTRNQQLIILSVAENGVSLGDQRFDDPEKYANGVYIYAEKVSATSFSAPYGLTVSTWHLAGGRDGQLTLDASGNRGGIGTPGDPDGRPGDRGGSIELYVQDLNDNAPKVVLLARGGAGGNNYSLNGKAGDGGDGGRIVSILQPTYLRVLDSVQGYLNRKEFAEERHRGNIVQKQDPLFVVTHMLLAAGEGLAASKITEIFGRLRAQVEKESPTVDDLRGAANFAKFTLQRKHIPDQQRRVALDPDNFRGGYRGTGGGKNGEAGMAFAIHASSMANIVTAPLPFAHPEQCAMLLERADIYFSVNSPPARSHAESLYQRLIERLEFLQSVPSSRLEKHYGYLQDRKVMPTNTIQRLQDILESASARLRSLKFRTTDFYGHAERWVPRASYTEYAAELDKALEDFESFEAAYILYHSALEEQAKLKDRVDQVSSQASQMVARLEDDTNRLLRDLGDLDGKIATKKFIVEAAKRELEQAYEAEESNIENAFGVGVPQIINALRNIVMFPEKGVAALEAGDLIFQGFTSVPTNTGSEVKKEYLASEFKKSKAKIASLCLELGRQSDGEYSIDTAVVPRIVVEKEHMMAELDEFSGQAFGGVNDATTKKQLEGCFNAYIREVTERNNLIFRYNLSVKRLCDTLKEKAKHDAENRNLQGMLADRNDPDLPTIAAHIGTIYQSSRSRVIRLLNILLRALSFRTLGSHGVLDFTSGSSGNDVPLSLTCIELKNARGNIEQRFHRQFEGWDSEPERFPVDWKKNRGERYSLDEHDRNKLVTKHSVTLSIPPVLRGSTGPGAFAGYCNVRIYQARFGFTGLKTANGVKEAKVQVALTHCGNEIIVSRDKAIEFEHDSVPVIYSFILRDDDSTLELNDGNIGVADINQTATSYAPVGPFAQWTVSLAGGTEFDKLDFRGVDDAFFNFYGTYYALG